MIYSPYFIGFAENSPEGLAYIDKVRAEVKGSGFKVWRRGRNPNRKQFVSQVHCHSRLRQSIPCQFASYFGLYLRKSNGDTPYHATPELTTLKGKIALIS